MNRDSRPDDFRVDNEVAQDELPTPHFDPAKCGVLNRRDSPSRLAPQAERRGPPHRRARAEAAQEGHRCRQRELERV
jgi:hypothetical protein